MFPWRRIKEPNSQELGRFELVGRGAGLGSRRSSRSGRSGWQSGLHSLRPGAIPDWSPLEGLMEGTAEDPRAALWSRRREPNTIHCLSGQVPAAY